MLLNSGGDRHERLRETTIRGRQSRKLDLQSRVTPTPWTRKDAEPAETVVPDREIDQQKRSVKSLTPRSLVEASRKGKPMKPMLARSRWRTLQWRF